jgi:hypothetical protein
MGKMKSITIEGEEWQQEFFGGGYYNLSRTKRLVPSFSSTGMKWHPEYKIEKEWINPEPFGGEATAESAAKVLKRYIKE